MTEKMEKMDEGYASFAKLDPISMTLTPKIVFDDEYEIMLVSS